MKFIMKTIPKYTLFLLIILSLLSPDIMSQGKQVVTASDLEEWVSYLSSDEMKGRANGSPEMKTAADWIASRFRENSVKPAYGDRGYLQNYSYSTRGTEVNERNVIGIIEGTDPKLKNEYIVLSAHFDHVGIRKGAKPDSIFNGADDNAAGTCTLIGIARAIKLSGLKPGRTLIFAAFSGEENGMRGSRNFVANPVIPLKSIYADINFEMIGHSESYGKNNFYMTGCLVSNLDNIIGEYNRNTPFKLIDTISIAERLFFASDNIAFSRISISDGITYGIPSGTFATTTTALHVHSAADEAKLFDFENMANLVNHFTGMVVWLSHSNSEVVWTDPKFSRLK